MVLWSLLLMPCESTVVMFPGRTIFFRWGEHDGIKAALFFSSKVYLLHLDNNPLYFYFALSFFFVLSFYSPRDACTSALVDPDAFCGLSSINTTELRASIMPCRTYGSMPAPELYQLLETKECRCTVWWVSDTRCSLLSRRGLTTVNHFLLVSSWDSALDSFKA